MNNLHKGHPSVRSAHGQRGVVLVIALIMLVVMTLMALSAAQVTGLDERMVGHSRDRDVAFQAAEAALREGERVLQQAVIPAFDGTAGLYPVAGPGSTPLWKTLDWTSAGISYGATISGVDAQPRYIVEEVAALIDDDVAMDPPATTSTYYRVTSRAVGGDGNTVVVLQTTYRRR